MTTQTGTVLDMQRKEKVRGALEPLTEAKVTIEKGIEGDARGALKNAQITLVSKQAWEATMADLKPETPVDWTARRANILVDGIDLMEMTGAHVTIGDVLLEVTEETHPCEMMDKAYPGLKDALTPDWRGGCRCNVLRSGTIRIGDPVMLARMS